MTKEEEKEWQRQYHLRKKEERKQNPIEDEIYKAKQKAYHQNYAKENHKRITDNRKIFYDKNREKILITAKEYRESHRDQIRVVQRKWRNDNSDMLYEYRHTPIGIKRMKACSRADYHVKLDDKVCEVCGGTDRLQRHHNDYNKPKEVVIMCMLCHKDWHKNNNPIY